MTISLYVLRERLYCEKNKRKIKRNTCLVCEVFIMLTESKRKVEPLDLLTSGKDDTLPYLPQPSLPDSRNKEGVIIFDEPHLAVDEPKFPASTHGHGHGHGEDHDHTHRQDKLQSSARMNGLHSHEGLIAISHNPFVSVKQDSPIEEKEKDVELTECGGVDGERMSSVPMECSLQAPSFIGFGSNSLESDLRNRRGKALFSVELDKPEVAKTSKSRFYTFCVKLCSFIIKACLILLPLAFLISLLFVSIHFSKTKLENDNISQPITPVLLCRNYKPSELHDSLHVTLGKQLEQYLQNHLQETCVSNIELNENAFHIVVRNHTDHTLMHFLNPILYFSNVTSDGDEMDEQTLAMEISETTSICESGMHSKQLNQTRFLHVISYYQMIPYMNFVNHSVWNEAAICLQHYTDICTSNMNKWCEKN